MLNSVSRRVPLACLEGFAAPQLEEGGRRRRLEKALRAGMEECLTPRQREIAELYYFDGLSMGEVGEALGIGRPAVCRSLQASREKLRLVGRLAAILLEG